MNLFIQLLYTKHVYKSLYTIKMDEERENKIRTAYIHFITNLLMERHDPDRWVHVVDALTIWSCSSALFVFVQIWPLFPDRAVKRGRKLISGESRSAVVHDCTW